MKSDRLFLSFFYWTFSTKVQKIIRGLKKCIFIKNISFPIPNLKEKQINFMICFKVIRYLLGV